MKLNCFPIRTILLANAIAFLPLTGRGADGGTWVKKADMPTPRIGLTTCVVAGKIYAIGGYREAGASGMETVETYDPVTDSWTRKTAMPTARLMLACAAVAGKIYAIGGDQSFVSNPMKLVEEYDPATDTWTRKADMPTARSGIAAAVVDGRIYVIGGLTTFGASPLSTVEVYDPGTDTWARKAAMPTGRGLMVVSAVGGKIYTIGSSSPPSGPWLPTVEVYDPLTDTWSRKTNMPTARGASAGGTVHGKIYVMGGRNADSSLATVEEYNPLSDTWIERASMWTLNPTSPSRRWNFSASEVNDRIYAIGGAFEIGESHPGVSLVLEYTPPDVDSGPPLIYFEPNGQSVLLAGTIAFTVGATGAKPLFYQWQFNGLPLTNATNATLRLSSLTTSNAGDYRVTVSNALGVATSAVARLVVVDRLTITTPPQSIQVVAGSTIDFFAVAMGPLPITYQWRLNGVDLPGKTNQLLTLTGVSPAMEGAYTVVVTDATNSVVSPPATLAVLFKPAFVQAPLSQSVVVGGSVTFSVEITGTTPFTYQWRRGPSLASSTLLTEVNSAEKTAYFTLTNVQPADAGIYRLLLGNVASPMAPNTILNRAWQLTVLPDTDGDGLPDAWETANALNPNDPTDVLLDSDGDGISNLAEYRSGTVPTNAASALRVKTVAYAKGQATVTFTAAALQTYTVEAASQAAGGTWEKVADIIARPIEHLETVTDTRAGPGARFYRVVTPRRP